MKTSDLSFDISQYDPQPGRIRFSRVIVDPAIQRDVVDREVNAIAAEFTPGALGFVVVNVRDNGEWVLVDGQQRKTAAAVANWDGEVNAIIYKGLPPKYEAELFRRLNFRTGVNAIAAFKVAVVEGLPAAVAVHSILQRFEIAVPGVLPGKIKFHGIQSALRIVQIQGGATDLAWAFDIAVSAWGNGDETYYDARVIEGLAWMHRYYIVEQGRTIDVTSLIKKLSAEGGGQSHLIGLGKTIKMTRRGALYRRVADAIRHVYNKGRQGKGTELPELPR